MKITKIAILDDSSFDRAYVGERVKICIPNVEVTEFKTSQELRAALIEEHFDIIFLDILGLGGTNLKIAGHIRAAHPGTRLITMSGSSTHVNRFKALGFESG